MIYTPINEESKQQWIDWLTSQKKIYLTENKKSKNKIKYLKHLMATLPLVKIWLEIYLHY